MKENKTLGRWAIDAVLMLITFFVIQEVVNIVVMLVDCYLNHTDFTELAQGVANGTQGKIVAVSSVMSSLITIMLFPRLRWTPIDRTYLRSQPWITLLWCALLALGTILPFEWVYEKLQIQINDADQALFESVMREPWGYVALGVLAPIAEEFVFRGGILRVLLNIMRGRNWREETHDSSHDTAHSEAFTHKWSPYVAIALSALLFGAVHMNLAQGVHGFIMGLLLGWLYYRTGSMMPAIIIHWVNNTVAYVMFALMPQMADGKLIDLFHGSERMMLTGILCSLCIFFPSLFQIIVRTKK